MFYAQQILRGHKQKKTAYHQILRGINRKNIPIIKF